MIILPSRNGMLLRNSNGILAADCGGPVEFNCPCELLTGTNCSCFGNNLTPSTYIADFGEMGKFCLNYVSGCTWQKSVGTITVTLNLTYATNTTRLTVVDGSATVFSGDLVETDCNDRKYGIITNTVSPSDWGDGFFLPGCTGSTSCGVDRLVYAEFTPGDLSIVGSSVEKTIVPVGTVETVRNYPSTYQGYGYISPPYCSMIVGNAEYITTYGGESSGSCSASYNVTNTQYLLVLYNASTGTWSASCNKLFSGELIRDVATIAVGETIVINNTLITATSLQTPYRCLDGSNVKTYETYFNSAPKVNSYAVTITVY